MKKKYYFVPSPKVIIEEGHKIYARIKKKRVAQCRMPKKKNKRKSLPS